VRRRAESGGVAFGVGALSGRRLCGGVVDFVHLGVLNDGGVVWVTRSKEPPTFPAPITPILILFRPVWSGMARANFFLTEDGQVLLNED